MGKASFVIAATLVVLLVGGAVGVYAYDSSREDVIADGVTVGGVDVGGMTADKARAALRFEIKQPLSRSIRVEAAGEQFELSAKEAQVSADVDAMVDDALAESRDGNVLSRTFRDLTGGSVDASLPSRVTYSRDAVKDLVADVQQQVEQDPQDAGVVPTGSGLETTPAQSGVDVHGDDLARALTDELESPDGDRQVRADLERVKPEVTQSEVAQEYPHYITVDRASFQLRYYENLKLVDTYTIAVGTTGFDTPAGEYEIETKAANPAWYVPNSKWAGDLAGKIIAGNDPENPIKARWMGFHDGAGIHGTADAASIGTAASHGCIRMLIPEVIDLYDRVPLHTPLYIS
jgi:lipoprotein-anchoring transpeptidase ErfK/SrfK